MFLVVVIAIIAAIITAIVGVVIALRVYDEVMRDRGY
jgi:hypothetical protein